VGFYFSFEVIKHYICEVSGEGALILERMAYLKEGGAAAITGSWNSFWAVGDSLSRGFTAATNWA